MAKITDLGSSAGGGSRNRTPTGSLSNRSFYNEYKQNKSNNADRAAITELNRSVSSLNKEMSMLRQNMEHSRSGIRTSVGGQSAFNTGAQFRNTGSVVRGRGVNDEYSSALRRGEASISINDKDFYEKFSASIADSIVKAQSRVSGTRKRYTQGNAANSDQALMDISGKDYFKGFEQVSENVQKALMTTYMGKLLRPSSIKQLIGHTAYLFNKEYATELPKTNSGNIHEATYRTLRSIYVAIRAASGDAVAVGTQISKILMTGLDVQPQGTLHRMKSASVAAALGRKFKQKLLAPLAKRSKEGQFIKSVRGGGGGRQESPFSSMFSGGRERLAPSDLFGAGGMMDPGFAEMMMFIMEMMYGPKKEKKYTSTAHSLLGRGASIKYQKFIDYRKKRHEEYMKKVQRRKDIVMEPFNIMKDIYSTAGKPAISAVQKNIITPFMGTRMGKSMKEGAEGFYKSAKDKLTDISNSRYIEKMVLSALKGSRDKIAGYGTAVKNRALNAADSVLSNILDQGPLKKLAQTIQVSSKRGIIRSIRDRVEDIQDYAEFKKMKLFGRKSEANLPSIASTTKSTPTENEPPKKKIPIDYQALQKMPYQQDKVNVTDMSSKEIEKSAESLSGKDVAEAQVKATALGATAQEEATRTQKEQTELAKKDEERKKKADREAFWAKARGEKSPGESKKSPKSISDMVGKLATIALGGAALGVLSDAIFGEGTFKGLLKAGTGALVGGLLGGLLGVPLGLPGMMLGFGVGAFAGGLFAKSRQNPAEDLKNAFSFVRSVASFMYDHPEGAIIGGIAGALLAAPFPMLLPLGIFGGAYAGAHIEKWLTDGKGDHDKQKEGIVEKLGKWGDWFSKNKEGAILGALMGGILAAPIGLAPLGIFGGAFAGAQIQEWIDTGEDEFNKNNKRPRVLSYDWWIANKEGAVAGAVLAAGAFYPIALAHPTVFGLGMFVGAIGGAKFQEWMNSGEDEFDKNGKDSFLTWDWVKNDIEGALLGGAAGLALGIYGLKKHPKAVIAATIAGAMAGAQLQNKAREFQDENSIARYISDVFGWKETPSEARITGGVIGGVLGFALGGPIGLPIGVGLGIITGEIAGSKIATNIEKDKLHAKSLETERMTYEGEVKRNEKAESTTRNVTGMHKFAADVYMEEVQAGRMSQEEAIESSKQDILLWQESLDQAKKEYEDTLLKLESKLPPNRNKNTLEGRDESRRRDKIVKEFKKNRENYIRSRAGLIYSERLKRKFSGIDTARRDAGISSDIFEDFEEFVRVKPIKPTTYIPEEWYKKKDPNEKQPGPFDEPLGSLYIELYKSIEEAEKKKFKRFGPRLHGISTGPIAFGGPDDAPYPGMIFPKEAYDEPEALMHDPGAFLPSGAKIDMSAIGTISSEILKPQTATNPFDSISTPTVPTSDYHDIFSESAKKSTYPLPLRTPGHPTPASEEIIPYKPKSIQSPPMSEYYATGDNPLESLISQNLLSTANRPPTKFEAMLGDTQVRLMKLYERGSNAIRRTINAVNEYLLSYGIDTSSIMSSAGGGILSFLGDIWNKPGETLGGMANSAGQLAGSAYNTVTGTLPVSRDGLKSNRKFLAAMAETAKAVGMDPVALLAVMEAESGVNPRAMSATGGAGGLIQFTEGGGLSKIAPGLTPFGVSSLSWQAQLDLTRKYLQMHSGRGFNSIEDSYLSVLAPGYMGKPPNTPIYTAPSKAYDQNRGLDFNNDGSITNTEAAVKTIKFYNTMAEWPIWEELGVTPRFKKSMFQRISESPIIPTSLGEWPSIDSVRRVTSKYGPRKLPYETVPRMHQGIDIASSDGSSTKGKPALTPWAGEVDYTGNISGGGNSVIVEHPNNYTTAYMHLDKISVRPGDKLQPNQQVGLIGNTGKSTGPHLHFEVWSGKRKEGTALDPLKVLASSEFDVNLNPRFASGIGGPTDRKGGRYNQYEKRKAAKKLQNQRDLFSQMPVTTTKKVQIDGNEWNIRSTDRKLSDDPHYLDKHPEERADARAQKSVWSPENLHIKSHPNVYTEPGDASPSTPKMDQLARLQTSLELLPEAISQMNVLEMANRMGSSMREAGERIANTVVNTTNVIAKSSRNNTNNNQPNQNNPTAGIQEIESELVNILLRGRAKI